MKLKYMILNSLKKHGNTVCGEELWNKNKEEILALLHTNGIEVKVRHIDEKTDELFGILLTGFYVIEVAKNG